MIRHPLAWTVLALLLPVAPGLPVLAEEGAPEVEVPAAPEIPAEPASPSPTPVPAAPAVPSRRDAIQKQYQTFKDSVVVVSFLFRGNDQAGQPQAQAVPQRIPGILVDGRGLVMVSSINFPEQAPLNRFSEFRVITGPGPEEEGYPARFLGRGRCPHVAFLRIQDPKKLPEIHPATFEDVPPQLGDEFMILGPSDRRDRPMFVLGTCNLMLDGVVQGWGMTMVLNPGCLIVSSEGKATGVMAGVLRGPQQVVSYALPAKEFLADIQAPPAAPHVGPAGTPVAVPAKPRGWLGISYIQPIQSSDMAEDFGLPANAGGIIVGGVIDESPAAKAGFQPGDVIVKFDGHEVKRDQKSLADFQLKGQRVAPGERIPVTLWRDGKTLDVALVAAPMPKLAAQAERFPLQPFGLVIREVVLDDRYALRLSKDEKGVLCEQVVPGTRAGDAGLAPNDLVKKINGEEIATVADFRRVFKAHQEARTAELFLTVLRQGRDTLICRMEPRWDALNGGGDDD